MCSRVECTLIELVESWQNLDHADMSLDEIKEWISDRNDENTVNIQKINFYGDGQWKYSQKFKGIINAKHAFFSIVGIQQMNANKIIHEQPIIIQQEIGYLGIICKDIPGKGLHLLMQAKIEPGNINKIQISPTIQATKSNFMQMHGGSVPPYLEFFIANKKYEVIVDQIQSEQSSRFLGKRNRNIIIKVGYDCVIDVLPSYRWMTLGQIKELMKYDNLVNMDTRTVISCIPFSLKHYTKLEYRYMETLFTNKYIFQSIFGNVDNKVFNNIHQYINNYKMLNSNSIVIKELKKLADWEFTENREIRNKYGRGEFKVIYCDIHIDGREVSRWQQPLIEAVEEQILGLFFCRNETQYEFLIKAIPEVGCFDAIELGPTVQSIKSKFEESKERVDQLFYSKYREKSGVVFDGLFSEEGGRFYHEQNRNILIEIDKKELDSLPEGYFWVNFSTLNMMVQFNNYLNIQLRNLLAILQM